MKYDLLIRNASILDGSGHDSYFSDIAIKNDRIEIIGTVRGDSVSEIDAEGLTVTPGFIDVHTHDDRLVLADRSVLPKISQGVTSVVTGNCGISLAPMTRPGDPIPPLTLLGLKADLFYPDLLSYFENIRQNPSSVNVVPLVGHSALRVCAMSELNRLTTSAELGKMKDLLVAAMKAGAFGISTGLFYPPAQSADSKEIENLLSIVADFEGLQTSHLRDEGDGLMDALEEALNSAKKTNVPLVVSHLKCAGSGVWGKAAKVLARLDEAAHHQDVAFDVYPYDASSTMLNPDKLSGSRRIVVSWSEPHPEQAGKDLSDITSCWCCSPLDAARRLVPAGGIFYKMQERDIKLILAHPKAMIGSDGLPHDVHPHPRLWGTFPRILGHYVRDLGIMSLKDAVRRMTALPASVFGLADRGMIKEGFYADLTLFNEKTVFDNATYDAPRQRATGIEYVLVNGQIVWDGLFKEGVFPGRLLKRKFK